MKASNWLAAMMFLSVTSQIHATDYVSSSVLSEGKWVKISVAKEGVYQLTASQLAKWGFNDPSKVRLYGYGGEVISESMQSWPTDDLHEMPLYRGRSDKSLLFYAHGVTKWTNTSNLTFTRTINPYSTASYYFITASDGVEPMTFATDEQTSSQSEADDAETVTTFPEHVLHEVDANSWFVGGRNLYDSYNYINGATKKYSLSMPGVVTGSNKAKLKVVFTADDKSTLTVGIDGVEIGSIQFSELSSYAIANSGTGTYSFDPTGESVTATLTHNRDSEVNGRLDYLMACYERNLNLTGSYLCFRPSTAGNKIFSISGASSSTVVWNISSINSCLAVDGTLSGSTYTFASNNVALQSEYVAVNTTGSFEQPTFVGSIANQDLHSLEAIDMVIIIPANGIFADQAERLAEVHRAQGLNVEVVRADQVYNEFSSGTPDATAYRRFMKMLYDKAQTEDERPKYLLLFGDCVYDNRMLTTNMSACSQDDYLLCYESENSLSETKSYCSEDYYGFLLDNSSSDPCYCVTQLGVGRIPATTVSEAKAVVDKTISYMNNENPGKWQNVFTALADDDESPIHQKAMETVAQNVESSHPEMMVNRIYWDNYVRESSSVGYRYPAVTKAIKNQVNNGSLIINYVGHGGEGVLSHEYVLTLSDFKNFTSPYLPMWVFASCNVMAYDSNNANIGEELILKDNSGAIAVVGASRTVYSNYNSSLNTLLERYLLAKDKTGKRYTVGDAIRLTKASLVTGSDGYSDRTENKLAYALLGDPAVTLALPTNQVVVDTCTANAQAGGVMAVTGTLYDSTGNPMDDFSGKLELTAFDSKETVTTKGNISDEQIQTYKAYTKKLYAGSDSVRNGKFSIQFPVPLDINYSNDYGMMNLYAVDSNGTSAAGYYTNFIVGGSSETIGTDTQGPAIVAYLNTSSYHDGVTLNTTPYFVAQLQDDSGINTTGNGIGHDIVMIIDNDENQTYTLNDYYQAQTGSYSSGTVTYSIPELTEGKHQLLFRAWDTNNNSSVYTTTFNVSSNAVPVLSSVTCSPNPATDYTVFNVVADRPGTSLAVTLQVFDFTGRMLTQQSTTGVASTGIFQYQWDLTAEGARLQPGMYIYRISVTEGGATSNMQSGRIMILSNQ